VCWMEADLRVVLVLVHGSLYFEWFVGWKLMASYMLCWCSWMVVCTVSSLFDGC